jgi:hypothetical protein
LRFGQAGRNPSLNGKKRGIEASLHATSHCSPKHAEEAPSASPQRLVHDRLVMYAVLLAQTGRRPSVSFAGKGNNYEIIAVSGLKLSGWTLHHR